MSIFTPLPFRASDVDLFIAPKELVIKDQPKSPIVPVCLFCVVCDCQENQ